LPNVAVLALEHFVPSEPLILHHLSGPSTPQRESFLLWVFSGAPLKSVSSGEERNYSVPPQGWEGVYTNFFHCDDRDPVVTPA